MEIQQLEPRLENIPDEYEKAQKFKEYVQGIFIENNSQEEFKRRVDAIFNETFKGTRLWHLPNIIRKMALQMIGAREREL